MRTLPIEGHEAIGLDTKASDFTTVVGSIVDRDVVRACMANVDVVLHTATLHKPHVATHTRQAFVDTNITGTLHVLEEAVNAHVGTVIFTSTTSVFGRALTPTAGEPAAWITEDVEPLPKNIYGITKLAAEHLCELFHRIRGLPCVILRTSRFFPEEDDRREIRDRYIDLNAKMNEFLYRRVDVADVVNAHLLAMARAGTIGFGRYIVSATTPFTRRDAAALRTNPSEVVRRYVPAYEPLYAERGWSMFASIDRVYDNALARRELGWQPRFDFARVIDQLRAGEPPGSALAHAVGSKGYHAEVFADGPYPVDHS